MILLGFGIILLLAVLATLFHGRTFTVFGLS